MSDGHHTISGVKVCSGCNLSKPVSEFAWRNKAAGRRHARCRSCFSTTSRSHYQAKRQQYINRSKAWRQACREENQRRILAYLREHPCIDCGEADPVVLDFDHRGDKSFGIANMLQFVLWRRIEAEIAKCDVRCANCHRRKTARELGHWRSLAVLV